DFNPLVDYTPPYSQINYQNIVVRVKRKEVKEATLYCCSGVLPGRPYLLCSPLSGFPTG
ncbi:unnamed protein product, partial [Sphenostylis stenocarpa]